MLMEKMFKMCIFCIKIFEREYNIITKDGKSGNRKFKSKFFVIRMPIIKFLTARNYLIRDLYKYLITFMRQA